MMRRKLIKKGDFVLITTGCYSNYFLHYMAKALVDINIDDVQNKYFNSHKDEDKQYSIDSYALASFLQTGGYVEPIPAIEWHLEDYGNKGEMRLGDING